MMIRVTALAALVAITPAAAQQNPAPDQATAKAKKAEKKICHASSASTGSMMYVPPVCHTRAEWAALAAEGRDDNALHDGGGNTALRPVNGGN